jgi:hypothetical protein
MKRIIYLLIAVAGAATLALEVLAADSPASGAGLAFMAWGISPYLYLAVLNRWTATRGGSTAMFIIAALTIFLGVGMMIDAVHLHPDAQSGLVLLFAPLWQWFLLLIASVPLYLSNRGVIPNP